MTRYGDQVVDEAPADVLHLPFSWGRALLGRYDLVHAHWPEYLARHRLPPLRVGKRILFDLWVRRLTVRRTPVVRTLHNLEPHQAGDPAEAALLERFDRLTAMRIRLNPFTPAPGPQPTVTIPHGHYVDRFAKLSRPEMLPGRLLLVGSLKPYKGVDRLVAEFSAHDDPSLTLRIVGRPMTPGLADALASAAASDARISHRLGLVPDAAMVEEMARAELVVLPYREMHNSGVVLLALSIGRPVLVPDNDVNRWLADETGPRWVHRFDPPFTMAAVVDALASSRRRPDDACPTLIDRDWETVARRHAEAYWDLMAVRS